LNDYTLDPIIEASETFDATVCFAPLSATLWNSIVMLFNRILDSLLSSRQGLYFLLTFNLLLTDSFPLCVCDSGSLAWTLQLSRLRRGGSARFRGVAR
jgi:hypothetical protein